MRKPIYMAVTNDIYELPVYVCDNADELAYLLGVKKKTIFEVLAHGSDDRKKVKRKKDYLYKRVYYEE